MKKKKQVSLTAYLLKADYELGDPVIQENSMSKIELDFPNSGPGLLYFNRSRPHPPGWASFLGALGEEAISKLRVASVSVILILAAGGRHFAICFGHGYAYVDKGFVQPRFGLRTCLNVVDPVTIRSVDKRTFDSLGKLSREQSTRPVTVAEFGLEVDKDLLRGVVGKPRDAKFGSQIAGKDSLNVKVPIEIDQLPNFLAKCLTESRRTRYKEHFEFIDNIDEITDPILTRKLNEKLVENINNEHRAKIWLAIPDIVNWDSIAGFKYSSSKTDAFVSDIRFSDFEERWGIADHLTLHDLTSRRIYEYDGDEQTLIRSWSVHHCLYAEVRLDGKTYILTEGTWYNVLQNFVSSVEDEIANLAAYGKPLSIWGDEHEQHYNQRVAEQSHGELALMDRRLIRHGGGSSTIEFCDLLSIDKKIIHVKNYSGSSVLSHLFHQGTVSAVLTAGDPEFRRKVNDMLPKSHKLPLNNRFKSSDYEVVYGIGTREPIGFDLPFFSKVSLRNSMRQLRVYGYNVSLAKIKKSKLAQID